MSEWISVKDRLPDLGVEVLVANSDGCRVARAYALDEHGAEWSNSSDSCGCCDTFDCNVTHWMPLPEPPSK